MGVVVENVTGRRILALHGGGSLILCRKNPPARCSRLKGVKSRSRILTSFIFSQARITKLDLVRYYLSVAPGALAGIRDRPIVLKRFVNGAEAEAFYQKRAPEQASGVAADGHAFISFRAHRRRNCRG